MRISENRKKGTLEINTGDTPEMIAVCLNCKMPKCIEKCPKMRKHKPYSIPGKPGIQYPYKDGYMNLAEAQRQTGIDSHTLKRRIQNLGLTLEQAIDMGKPAPRKRKEKEHEPSAKARAEKA